MAERRKQPRSGPKQKTAKGLEIPVPKRKDVMRDLQKLGRPSQGAGPRREPPKRTD